MTPPIGAHVSPYFAVSAGTANTHAVDFESSSTQYAQILDAAQTGLDGMTDLTLEAWIRMETLATATVWHAVFGKTGVANRASYLLWFIPVGGQHSLILDAFQDGTNTTEFQWVWTPSLNTWYHLAMAFDGSAATATKAEAYIGGVSQGNGTILVDNSASSIHDGTSIFGLGATPSRGGSGGGGGKLPWDGQIDDARVWSVRRSTAEIQANMSNTLVGNEAGLEGMWRLDNNYTDQTANANTLTPISSPTFITSPLPW